MNHAKSADWVIAALFTASLLSGLVCAFMSLLLTGAGHGWYAPLHVSWIALVAGPVSLAALGARNSRAGILLIAVLVIAAIACDTWLVMNRGGGGEDSDSFLYVFSHGPSWVVTWLVTWLFWQATVGYALVLRLIHRDRRRTCT